jgi:WD40 repeat protein
MRDAFVSYSHAADGKLAPALQRALHRLARPWYRMRALNVFRDKTSLAVTPALWPSIEEELGASRYLILLGSPEAAASSWVTKEVQWWIDHKSVDTLLIAVTDGDIRWNTSGGDFDWDVTTVLPPCLRGRFHHQPLWVDLRFARHEDQLSLRHSEFRDAVLTLAAALHGRPKDELDGEDVRQHRRTRRLAQSAIAALVILTLTATWLSVVAVRNERVAVDRLSNLLASESDTSILRQDDPQRAILLALTAIDMRGTEATRSALFKALEGKPKLSKILVGHIADKLSASQFSGVSDLFYDPQTGELVSSGLGDGKIISWNPGTGKRRVWALPRYLHRGNIYRMALSRDGRMLASEGGANLGIWDTRTGKLLTALRGELGAFSPDGRLLTTRCRRPFRCDSGNIEYTFWNPVTWEKNSFFC